MYLKTNVRSLVTNIYEYIFFSMLWDIITFFSTNYNNEGLR